MNLVLFFIFIFYFIYIYKKKKIKGNSYVQVILRLANLVNLSEKSLK